MPILDISVSTESQCIELESDIRKVVITDYILDNISTEQRSHSNLEIIFEDDFISNEEVYLKIHSDIIIFTNFN